MDRVLEALRPHLEHMARPFADPARPVESTADLLQESCLRAWKKIDKFEGGRDDEETFRMFRGWIGQIVRRLGLTAQRDRDRLRRKPPGKLLRLPSGREEGIDPPALDPSPSAHVRADEADERVRQALGKITEEPDATILRLRFIEGLTLPRIAERLGIGEKKVRLRYEKALATLRREVGDLE